LRNATTIPQRSGQKLFWQILLAEGGRFWHHGRHMNRLLFGDNLNWLGVPGFFLPLRRFSVY